MDTMSGERPSRSPVVTQRRRLAEDDMRRDSNSRDGGLQPSTKASIVLNALKPKTGARRSTNAETALKLMSEPVYLAIVEAVGKTGRIVTVVVEPEDTARNRHKRRSAPGRNRTSARGEGGGTVGRERIPRNIRSGFATSTGDAPPNASSGA